MKERPILMSAPNVLALLRDVDPKTQTRRVIKPQPHHRYGDWAYGPPDGSAEPDGGARGYPRLLCPHGIVGDHLWVKETIRLHDGCDIGDEPIASIYAADGAYAKATAWPWQRRQLNSIHCPRGLSRITLEITEVRVERLNDISEADAIAEGIEPITDGWRDYMDPKGLCMRPHTSYMTLWDSINGAAAHKANPICWALTFKRVTP